MTNTTEQNELIELWREYQESMARCAKLQDSLDRGMKERAKILARLIELEDKYRAKSPERASA